MISDYRWHRLRADFLLFFNRQASGMAALESALAADESDTAAKITLGVYYGEKGQYAAAEKHFRSALRDEPENANYLFNLGFVQQKQDLHAEAINSFDATIRINPGLDRAWFGRGMSRVAMGQREQAIADFEQAAKLQPMNPHPLIELGLQYHAANNPAKVTEVIRKLREFDPKATKQLMQATQMTMEVKN